MATQTEINEISAKIGELSAVVNRLEMGQAESTKAQMKMALSITEMSVTIKATSKGKALNCGARILTLETNSDDCRGLRVGPRMEAIEKDQKAMTFGTLKIMVVAFISAITGASIKVFWK